MRKEEKIKMAEKLAEELNKYSVVGIIDLFKLPTRQVQEIKKKLRDKALIKVFKKSTILYAFKKAEKFKVLEKYLPSQIAILFSNEEPFKLYLTISKLKSEAFAKEGDKVEEDIVVHAGPTNLSPGPVMSEFGKLKIPVGVEGGKIAIKKDTVVAKKGDVISKDLASILRKLNIKPIKIGLNVVCLFDGNLYLKDVLDMVGENYLNKIKEAFNQALNLSINICYPTKENISYLLFKAFNQAKFIENKLIGGVN
jgi:large subunit ribosomal protein L10